MRGLKGTRAKEWRRRPGSNRRMEVLQTSALPLGYVAHRRKVRECSEPARERQCFRPGLFDTMAIISQYPPLRPRTIGVV
jgi:hypothetical protein